MSALFHVSILRVSLATLFPFGTPHTSPAKSRLTNASLSVTGNAEVVKAIAISKVGCDNQLEPSTKKA